MSELPPELEKFEGYLNSLPPPDNGVFLYRLCMLLRQAGKVRVTDLVPGGDEWSMVFFETPAGFRFHVIELYLDRVTHLEILKRLLPMLRKAEQELSQ